MRAVNPLKFLPPTRFIAQLSNRQLMLFRAIFHGSPPGLNPATLPVI
jgi:hypothetical protein